MRKINKPDTNNTDLVYWEEVLESHGLGIRQLGLHDEPEVTEDENFENAETISLEEVEHD